MLTISIILIASILAIIVLVFLLGSGLQDEKKEKILLVLGVLIFLSILISNVKSPGFWNQYAADQIYEVFYGQIKPFDQRYQLQLQNTGRMLLDLNYGKVGGKGYSENILFISKKNEGATYAMHQLASELRYQSIPTLYMSLASSSPSETQVLRETGLPSVEALKTALECFGQEAKHPYIIVDNMERLPNKIVEILKEVSTRYPMSIIGNMEDRTSLTNTAQQTGDQWITQFQVQRWQGPGRQILEQLSPTNSYLKKLPIDFQTIQLLSQGSSEEELSLRLSSNNRNIVSYYHLTPAYNQLKRRLEFGSLPFGELKKLQIDWSVLQRLKEIGLMWMENGEVKVR